MFQKNLYKTLALFLGVFVLSFLIGLVALAWTEPVQPPPGDNVPAPLNVSTNGQSKSGGLILNTGGAATGLIIDKGNVGIGTTDPKYKLDINGILRLQPLTYSPIGATKGVIYYDSITDKFKCYEGGSLKNCVGLDAANAFVQGGNSFGAVATLGTNDNFGLAFETNNVQRLRIDTTGNVGIGTTNPLIKLAIGDTDTGLHWISDGNLAVYTNNTERIRINSSGNIGIGTTNPTAKLEVNGQIKITGGNPGDNKVLMSDASGLASWQTATGNIGGSGTANFIPRFKDATTLENSLIKEQWYAPLADGKRFVIIGDGANAQPGTPRLQIFNKNDEILALVRVGALGGPIAQTTLRIGTDKATVISDLDYDYLTLKNGNVGIGTTNPAARLQVEATPGAYQSSVLINVKNPYQNAGPALRLAGAGTYTTPTTLEIRRLDTENKEISFSLMNNAYNNGFKIKMPPDSNDVYFDLYGLGGDGEIIIKRDTGNVGIGTYTSDPTAKLDINGQIRIRGGGPGPNKVLTSDAAGLASWQPGVAGGGVGGSGTDNYIPRWLGTNSLENSVIYQTDAGNVSIGDIGSMNPYGPYGKLEVIGSSTLTDPFEGLAGHPIGITLLNTSDTVGSYTSIMNSSRGYSPGGVNGARSGIFFKNTGGALGGQIDFFTSDDTYYSGWSGVRMSINQRGAVGIGTTSPERSLEILTSPADGAQLRLSKKILSGTGSVDLFSVVGENWGGSTGDWLCRTAEGYSAGAICLGAWRSPIQGGGNIDCTLSETGVRALCANIGQ